MFFFRQKQAPGMSPAEAIEGARDGSVTVIDVREHGEVAMSGKAKGALHIPLMRLRDMADQLIKIAAERMARKADPIEPASGIFDEFCAAFPYAGQRLEVVALGQEAAEVVGRRLLAVAQRQRARQHRGVERPPLEGVGRVAQAEVVGATRRGELGHPDAVEPDVEVVPRPCHRAPRR